MTTRLLFISLLLSACTSTEYVPVETIQTETKYVDRVQYDSIYKSDSVYIRQKGDTFYIDKYHYLYKYLFINRVDSFNKVDSIQVPYPVEKQLGRWDSFKIEIGGIALGVGFALLVIVIWFIFKRR